MKRVDKYQRILGWCEEGQTYCDVSEKAYKQGREDAIEEFIDRFNKSTIIMGRSLGRIFMLKCLNEIAEQMKGEKWNEE